MSLFLSSTSLWMSTSIGKKSLNHFFLFSWCFFELINAAHFLKSQWLQNLIHGLVGSLGFISWCLSATLLKMATLMILHQSYSCSLSVASFLIWGKRLGVESLLLLIFLNKIKLIMQHYLFVAWLFCPELSHALES